MLRPYAADSSPSSCCPPFRPSAFPPRSPTRHRRAVRDMGGRLRHDGPQGPVGNALPQNNALGEPRREAAGSPGLDRALGVQSSLLRGRGVRLGAPPGFSQGLEDSGVPGRRRDQPAGAPPVKPAPLGVFDSGIGGLTVARAVFERLPHESVIYFGDTARVPYGPKSPDTVRRYSGEILAYLLQRGVKALVVACNTISAQALDFRRARSRAVPTSGPSSSSGLTPPCASRPVRCSCRWWKRGGSTTRRRS